jgi:hypothetical protein
MRGALTVIAAISYFGHLIASALVFGTYLRLYRKFRDTPRYWHVVLISSGWFILLICVGYGSAIRDQLPGNGEVERTLAWYDYGLVWGFAQMLVAMGLIAKNLVFLSVRRGRT